MKSDHFFKYHALGNDYVVIDPNFFSLSLTKRGIQLICDRHFGVGSDGILFGPVISGETISLRIFNPDGSEAEKSGNGIRIFSRYLFDAGYLKSNSFRLQTPGGNVEVEILDQKAEWIKVNMGKVSFRSHEIPVKGKDREVVDEEINLLGTSYRMTCLTIGNPHCVLPVSDISKELATRLGPLIENHELFPNRINMQLLKVLDRENIKIEIWERGAGYTMASGSSSCAAASAAFRLGLVDNKIKVHMPGGTIEIDISEQGDVYMTGTVAGVARGVFTDEFLERVRAAGE